MFFECLQQGCGPKRISDLVALTTLHRGILKRFHTDSVFDKYLVGFVLFLFESLGLVWCFLEDALKPRYRSVSNHA